MLKTRNMAARRREVHVRASTLPLKAVREDVALRFPTPAAIIQDAMLPRYRTPSLKDVPGEVRPHVKLLRKLVEEHEKPIDTWQGQGFRLRHVNQVTATTSFVAINSRTNCEVDRQEPNLRHVNQGTTATAFIAINSRTNSEVDRQEPNLRHANQGTAATSFVA